MGNFFSISGFYSTKIKPPNSIFGRKKQPRTPPSVPLNIVTPLAFDFPLPPPISLEDVNRAYEFGQISYNYDPPYLINASSIMLTYEPDETNQPVQHLERIIEVPDSISGQET